IFRMMNNISIVKSPVRMQKTLPVSFVNRSPRNKIHGLNQHTLDVIFYHKLCKLIPYALPLIIRSQNKKPSDTETMPLDVPNGFNNLVPGAFLVIGLKRLIVQKFNPHVKFEK